MSRIGRIIHYACCPRFLDADGDMPYKRSSNYTRLWGICILLLMGVSLVPLGIMTAIDYNLTKSSLLEQNELRLLRVTSNARRNVAHFIAEQVSALTFTIEEESYRALSDSEHLATVLERLKGSFGGLIDLGLINQDGTQTAYAGPFGLTGRNYLDQEWFSQIMAGKAYISDVFLGFRNSPHMVIAVSGQRGGGSPFVLRATLDITQLGQMLERLDMGENGDAFLVNGQGVIQTPARTHGDVLHPMALPVPPYSERTSLFRAEDTPDATPPLVGYAYIEDSPFILIMTSPRQEVMQQWTDLRTDLLGIFIPSILLIIVVIYFISTYMINHVHESDRQQAQAMQHMEDTNRLASIGRLAAGVAHEINNPLAIINMKAGLIKDMFELKQEYETDDKLMEQINAVISSVERCGLITKQLLGFAREVELNVQELSIEQVAHEVLGFLGKEADYRGIDVRVDVDSEVPAIRSDRGKLQQILLNIVNNAFQAMHTGGTIHIQATTTEPDRVSLAIADTGPGITEEHLKKIFEPFFSTKKKQNGSGLGLSITYGLVKKLGGTIDVSSEPGVGTTFTLTFPLSMDKGDQDETAAG